eukprot:752171-Hanusia_phi.AAC.1
MMLLAELRRQVLSAAPPPAPPLPELTVTQRSPSFPAPPLHYVASVQVAGGSSRTRTRGRRS